jgi:hypothetical protein
MGLFRGQYFAQSNTIVNSYDLDGVLHNKHAKFSLDHQWAAKNEFLGRCRDTLHTLSELVRSKYHAMLLIHLQSLDEIRGPAARCAKASSQQTSGTKASSFFQADSTVKVMLI